MFSQRKVWKHLGTQFTINDHPAAEDLAFIENQIMQFNFATTGFHDGKMLSIFVRNEKDEMIAGVSGFTWGGYCMVEWLWVHADWRHQSYGRQMMLAVEAEAWARNCGQIVLLTHSFQAPGFYHKLGYETIGVWEDCPKGYREIFLKKSLK